MYVEAGPLQDSGKTLPSLQEKYYQRELRQSLTMPKGKEHIAAALESFSRGVAVLMSARGIESDSELARIVEKKVAGAPSRKTINNALAGRHDAQISTLEAIAEALDCPLWVLLLVGRSDKDLLSPARERLAAMVASYLKCGDESRHHIEGMAAAFAAKERQ